MLGNLIDESPGSESGFFINKKLCQNSNNTNSKQLLNKILEQSNSIHDEQFFSNLSIKMNLMKKSNEGDISMLIN